MAAKNSIKVYVENGIYHLYNRGVAKNDIFLDQQDFAVFCLYLKVYLLPKDTQKISETMSSKNTTPKEKDTAIKLLSLKNFSEEISLIAYALLPNHFHFLIKQQNADAIDRFMNSLGVRYSGYFNRKYRRVGPVFQGRYKAVLVNTNEQLFHLSRYINLNPHVKLHLAVKDWRKIPWPYSLPEYFRQRDTDWVKPQLVLDYFNKTSHTNNYEKFVNDSLDPTTIAPLMIDYDDN